MLFGVSMLGSGPRRFGTDASAYLAAGASFFAALLGLGFCTVGQVLVPVLGAEFGAKNRNPNRDLLKDSY